MTELEFLEHHGLRRNPFADEDAQTDTVFKGFCIAESFHPAWSKVFGDPAEPSTAIVLGPKGSGKTAIRLQMVSHLQKYNREHPNQRVFFLQYDDFNAYLGPLQSRLVAPGRNQPEKVLASIRLWDHLDAILCLATTTLLDRVLLSPSNQPANDSLEIPPDKVSSLDQSQKRDLLLLAACYDQPRHGSFSTRIVKLASQLRYSNYSTWQWLLVGFLGSLLSVAGGWLLAKNEIFSAKSSLIIGLTIFCVSWLPYVVRYLRHFLMARQIVRHVRVGRRDSPNLCRLLMMFPSPDLASQPLPINRRSDDRYALLEKLQLLLRSLGFSGLVVIVDRVDEPELVNGQPDRMKWLIWPMLDNKLLKHPGLGIKLLLQSELAYFLDRESKEFHERARLDKQNFVGNFDWTGEALYDVTVARMKACGDANTASLNQLLDDKVSESRLIAAMQSLKTPRNLFRFFYRLIAEHCKQHRSSNPSFKISSETFEATLAVFQNELARSA
jgi:hypothetical protein